MLEEHPDPVSGQILAKEFAQRTPPVLMTTAAEHMLERLREIPEGSGESVVTQAVPIMQEWIREQFGSPTQMEESARRLRAEQARHHETTQVQVNELVNYDLHDENTSLALHIDMAGGMLMEKPLALVAKFRSAMREIAQQLSENPELATVKIISGDSPLIPRFAPMLEAIGFHIMRNEDGTMILEGRRIQSGHMEMSREEFIKQFGPV